MSSIMHMNCNSKYIYKQKTKLTTMAEIIENKMEHHNVPSMAKANAGLTLG